MQCLFLTSDDYIFFFLFMPINKEQRLFYSERKKKHLFLHLPRQQMRSISVILLLLFFHSFPFIVAADSSTTDALHAGFNPRINWMSFADATEVLCAPLDFFFNSRSISPLFFNRLRVTHRNQFFLQSGFLETSSRISFVRFSTMSA